MQHHAMVYFQPLLVNVLIPCRHPETRAAGSPPSPPLLCHQSQLPSRSPSCARSSQKRWPSCASVPLPTQQLWQGWCMASWRTAMPHECWHCSAPFSHCGWVERSRRWQAARVFQHSSSGEPHPLCLHVRPMMASCVKAGSWVNPACSRDKATQLDHN